LKGIIFLTIVSIIAVMTTTSDSNAFPLNFSFSGSIGSGYYSMNELNTMIQKTSQEKDIQIDKINKGVNVGLHGRVWLFDTAAVTGGFEHFWAESTTNLGDIPLTFKAPADVYSIGLLAKLHSLASALDVCFGASENFVKSQYGSNLNSGRILREYKSNGKGMTIYAEIHTNFLHPLEVGTQLGYRFMKIKDFKDKNDNPLNFDSSSSGQIDYSGFYFYIMSGFRI